MFMCFSSCFMTRSVYIHVYMLGSMFYHVYMLAFTCSHTCCHAYAQIYVFTCLCAWINALCISCCFPCPCVIYAMFMCLDLGYVCHVMCYCTFCRFIFLSCALAYWLESDLDPMVFVIIHTPRPTSKGLDHSHFTCLCLLAPMLYACVSLSCSRLCHV